VADLIARSIELTGAFTVPAPIGVVFELFSPLGERSWVPDWNPELLYPLRVAWQRNQIFRTQEALGEAIWIVTELNRASHHVEYHRVEPHHYVARVSVKCEESHAATTEVSVEYVYVGLSSAGNVEIAAMTAEAYSQKMDRWKQWIIERALSKQ
jgi:hypothetical protein